MCLEEAFPRTPNCQGLLERQSPAGGALPRRQTHFAPASGQTDLATWVPGKCLAPPQKARFRGEPRRLLLQKEEQLLRAISAGSPKMPRSSPAGTRPPGRTSPAISTDIPSKDLSLFPLCAQKPPARESNTPTLALENASRGPASRGQHLPFSPPSTLLTSLLSPSLSFLLSLLPSFGGSFSECQAWEPDDQDQNPSSVTCKLCDLGQATQLLCASVVCFMEI